MVLGGKAEVGNSKYENAPLTAYTDLIDLQCDEFLHLLNFIIFSS